MTMSGENDMAGGWAGDPRAVRDANDGVRYFRSWTQFLGAFIKMMIVMVATEMVSWPFILTYLSQLIQMAEQERLDTGSCFLTILYDDLLRKNWMMRALRKDPTLNLMNEAMTVDKQIKAAAEQRLGFVLQAANIRFPNSHQRATSDQGFPGAEANSVLMKTTAAAEAMRKKAEEARRDLEKQQREFDKKGRDLIKAVQNGVHPAGGDPAAGGARLVPNNGWESKNGNGNYNGGNGGQGSKSKMKAQQYFEKCKDWRKNNGGR